MARREIPERDHASTRETECEWSIEIGGDLDLADVFGALANPDRLAILEILGDAQSTRAPGMSISMIAARTELSRFSASRHLRILCDAGVVQPHRVGPAILHSLSLAGLERAEDWLVALSSKSVQPVALRM